MKVFFLLYWIKKVLCDADQIIILWYRLNLICKNWSYLTPPTSYPKYLLILALMDDNCPSYGGAVNI